MSVTPAAVVHAQDETESAGARQAALFLHGLAPEDRAWVLGAMPADQRASLQSLLSELEALGIGRDPALVADATGLIEQVSGPALHDAPLSEEDMLRALDGERLATVVNALRREPAALVASWLNMTDWPWREELLRAMEPLQRARVEAALAATGPVPPQMRAQLVAAAVACLRRPAPLDPSPGRWRALARAMRRLRAAARILRRESP